MITNGRLHTLEAQTGNTGFTWQALEGLKGPFHEKITREAEELKLKKGKGEGKTKGVMSQP